MEPAVRTVLWVVVLSLAGCRSERQAQLVVVVHSDMVVPEQLDTIRARVTTQEGDLAYEGAFALGEGDGAYELPVDFGVAPREGDVRRRVTIEVDAVHEGETLFTTTTITTFVKKRRLRVDIFLAASCVARARLCAPEETCRREGCVPPAVDSSALPEFVPGEPAPDAGVIDAGPVMPAFGPAVLVGEISTTGSEQDPIPSPDGLLLVFERNGVDPCQRDLWIASRASADQPWANERELTELDTCSDEGNAAWLEEGGNLWLYYVSDFHETGATDEDILIAGWRPATSDFELWGPLTSIDTPDGDKDPSLTLDGHVLIFQRPVDGVARIWEARGDPLDAYVDPGAPVPELVGPDSEYDPAISPDGLTIAFISMQPPSQLGDIWVAQRRHLDAPFDAPVQLPVGDINTEGDEKDVFISADGDLWFTSDRDGDRAVYVCEGNW